jgi:type IV secretory pathway VirJ component
MRRIVFFLALLFSVHYSFSQGKDLPVRIEKSDSAKYLALYVSGDGGRGFFDSNLSRELRSNHISVIYLNSFKYFRPGKTPDQFAGDIVPVLKAYDKKWNNEKIILIGYSFGGDVVPFLYTRLPEDLKQKVNLVVLLAPASTSDFTVHLSDMMGADNEYNYNVIREVEQIKIPPVLVIFGYKEHSSFPSDYQQDNLKIIFKKGHHRFTDEDFVMENILKELNR